MVSATARQRYSLALGQARSTTLHLRCSQSQQGMLPTTAQQRQDQYVQLEAAALMRPFLSWAVVRPARQLHHWRLQSQTSALLAVVAQQATRRGLHRRMPMLPVAMLQLRLLP